MDNFSSLDFNNNMDTIFKKITGLDLRNHTEEEWQEWYHNNMRESAKTDSYVADILDCAERIIEKKDYSTLCAILKNYDYYVKLATNSTRLDHPFWCYGFGLRPSKEEE